MYITHGHGHSQKLLSQNIGNVKFIANEKRAPYGICFCNINKFSCYLHSFEKKKNNNKELPENGYNLFVFSHYMYM